VDKAEPGAVAVKLRGQLLFLPGLLK